MTTETKNLIDFVRVNNDVNGNPRFVCHFLNFVNNEESEEMAKQHFNHITPLYELALRKSRKIGGKKYHNKQYGGGIAIQMYRGDEEKMSEMINKLKNNLPL